MNEQELIKRINELDLALSEALIVIGEAILAATDQNDEVCYWMREQQRLTLILGGEKDHD